MRRAWKEYLEICKMSGKWMCEHWIGYSLFCIILTIISCLSVSYHDEITDFIKSIPEKFKKEES